MNYQFDSRRERSRAKQKRVRRLIILLLVSSFLLFLGPSILEIILPKPGNTADNTSGTNVLSPLGSIINEAVNGEQSKLPEVILPILEDELGDYSIVIKHLQTGEAYSLEPEKQYISASLYKLWVMGAVYEKLEDETLSKERVMSDEIPKINERFNIASESAERTEGSISMSIDEALREMITVSHNYAALLLSQTVTLSSTRAFMEEYGYDDSFLDPPTTTASDIALFYTQLYNKEIVSQSASEEMMALLKAQEWNDRIPKYLPKETVIAHKTGELYDVKHDAGIVFTDKGDYILVLLSETPSQENAAEIEAKISEAVYEYFMKQN